MAGRKADLVEQTVTVMIDADGIPAEADGDLDHEFWMAADELADAIDLAARAAVRQWAEENGVDGSGLDVDVSGAF